MRARRLRNGQQDRQCSNMAIADWLDSPASLFKGHDAILTRHDPALRLAVQQRRGDPGCIVHLSFAWACLTATKGRRGRLVMEDERRPKYCSSVRIDRPHRDYLPATNLPSNQRAQGYLYIPIATGKMSAS